MFFNKKIIRYYWAINPVFRKYSTIFLYGEKEDLIGRLYFEPDDQSVSTPNRFENGHIIIHFKWSDMALIIDMLRNEGPVWINANIEGTAIANVSIATDYAEPVGEGETTL